MHFLFFSFFLYCSSCIAFSYLNKLKSTITMSVKRRSEGWDLGMHADLLARPWLKGKAHCFCCSLKDDGYQLQLQEDEENGDSIDWEPLERILGKAWIGREGKWMENAWNTKWPEMAWNGAKLHKEQRSVRNGLKWCVASTLKVF